VKLFDLSLKLNGFPLKKAQEEYESILAVPEDGYQKFIEQKKQEIVLFHFENNPFYRSLVGNELPENWEDLPVLTKKDLQRPLEERLSDGYSLKNVYINRTSGSSGNPFIFARDKFSHALNWASIIKRFSFHNINFNSSLQARFYGMPLDTKGYYLIRLKDYLSCRYRFSILDFSDSAIEKIVEKFKRKPFVYINGYTTCIVQLAKYLEKKNITLTTLCPTLKVCITTSEMLFDDDKKLLTKTLGVPVVNEYGASELGVIAIENIENEWVVNQEDLFVEILDENNKPVEDGQEGNIIVTCLYNKANPFIRYKVGDIGSIQKINAKKTVLLNLKGRTNDFAILPSGKKAAGMTFYVLTKVIMDNIGNIKEFTIVQESLNNFTIEYSSERELSENEITNISNHFDNYLEKGLQYEFVRKDYLQRSKSGKLKQFKSMIN